MITALASMPRARKAFLVLLRTSSRHAVRLHGPHGLPAAPWQLLGLLDGVRDPSSHTPSRGGGRAALCPGSRLPGKQACSRASEISICKWPLKPWRHPGLCSVPTACEGTHTAGRPLLGTAARVCCSLSPRLPGHRGLSPGFSDKEWRSYKAPGAAKRAGVHPPKAFREGTARGGEQR